LAAADARAGRDGRNDAVSHVPWPDDVDRGEELAAMPTGGDGVTDR
jgi:hypothetical protein